MRESLNIHECAAYPSILKSKCSECFILLHVDDMMILSTRHFLDLKLKPAFEEKYAISIETLTDHNEICFLKRRHWLTEDGNLVMQPHHKHFDKLFELLKTSRRLVPKKTPVHPLMGEPDDSPPLSSVDATTFKSAVGILLYLSPDIPEAQFAIRGLSQYMASPTENSMKMLRHLSQYLLGAVNNGILIKKPTNEVDLKRMTLNLYTDADWAGDKSSRRSVTAVCVFLQDSLIYSASRTQKAIALSSAESELYSATSGLCDSILLRSCLEYMFDARIHLRLYVDNSACKQILRRSGVGRIRHLDCRVLWTQRLVQTGQLSVHHVETKMNPSDLFTKRLSRDRMLLLMHLIGCFDIGSDEILGKEQWEQHMQVIHFRQCVNVLHSSFNGPKKPIQRMIRMMMFASAFTP